MLAKRLASFSILSASLLVTSFFGLSLWLGSNDPVYNGKRASEWLPQLDDFSGRQKDEARNAFANMDSAAVPWLLEELNATKPAPWLRWKFDFKRLPCKRR